MCGALNVVLNAQPLPGPPLQRGGCIASIKLEYALNEMTDILDHHWMRLALRMAERGLGATAPNPSVGAVLVRDEVVVGLGWTQPAGGAHAEIRALEAAGAAAGGATLYVTLEPCSHTGRTGPCTGAVIAAGVARVVVGTKDHNAMVAGDGLGHLRAAGIEVAMIAEPLGAACRWVTAGHTLRHVAGRAFVQGKLAVSADEKFAHGVGAPVWVTGPVARAHGHLLRARADMIAVGSGTWKADTPGLTCRLAGLEARSPDRLVVTTRGGEAALPSGASAQDAAQDYLTVVDGLDDRGQAECEADGRQHIQVRVDETRAIDLAHLLGELAAGHYVTRLLVEGGPTLLAGFLRAGLMDEMVVFQSPKALGQDGQALPDAVRSVLAETPPWVRYSVRRVGPDRMTVYRCAKTDAQLRPEDS